MAPGASRAGKGGEVDPDPADVASPALVFSLRAWPRSPLAIARPTLAPAARQVLDEIVQMLTEEKFAGKMVVILAGYEAQVRPRRGSPWRRETELQRLWSGVLGPPAPALPLADVHC